MKQDDKKDSRLSEYKKSLNGLPKWQIILLLIIAFLIIF